MRILARLNRPWMHFIVLGALLFYLQGKLYPEPKPVVGPLNQARLEALQQQWLAVTGHLPSAEQQARMVASELDRDMLFQHAIAMNLHLYDRVVYQRLLANMRFLQIAEGKSEEELYQQALGMRLHLGDEVVKRRLIQVMEQLLLAGNPPPEPTEEEILAEFEERREELRRPARYSIEHLYFNSQREGEAEAVIAEISRRELSASEALDMSSPFLPGYRFDHYSADQLARNFGTEFVENLLASDPLPGTWRGPIRSTYGLHYVWVEAVEPERDAALEEVRELLLRDLESRATSEALQEGIAALREDYEVRI